MLLSGIARAESKEAIPFLLERDTDLLCLPGPTGKSLFCTAELACFLAQKQGITELSIADHALTPLVEEFLLAVVCCVRFSLHNSLDEDSCDSYWE